MREKDQSLKESLEVFYRMLFISDELLRRKSRNRWIASIHAYEKDRDGTKFTQEFGTLVGEVRAIAKKFTD